MKATDRHCIWEACFIKAKPRTGSFELFTCYGPALNNLTHNWTGS